MFLDLNKLLIILNTNIVGELRESIVVFIYNREFREGIITEF